MEMKAQQSIAAGRQQVWDALNDPEVLKAAIPGCETFERTGENSFTARITNRIGPVKASFSFVVEISELDPPNSYVINGKGQGGAAGFANGGARVSLQPDGDNTLLSYELNASVGGKLAQLGGRLIDGAAKKLAGQFFTRLGDVIASDEAEHEVSAEVDEVTEVKGAAEPEASGGQKTGFRRYGGIAAIVLLVLFLWLILTNS